MESHFIVADSGGTTTTWMYTADNGLVETIQTCSLHPRNFAAMSATDWEVLKTLLKPIFNKTLYFYGAGCGSDEIALSVKNQLEQLGFRQVVVYSDALGACRSVLGKHPGTVAILGTGSIVLNYDGEKITQRFGGFGPHIGDEGSGLYFGKLLIAHLLEMEEWNAELKAVFHSKSAVYSELAAPTALTFLSQVPVLVKDFVFSTLHVRNFELFAQLYLSKIIEKKVLSVVGSYGFERKNELIRVLNDFNWSLNNVVANPTPHLFAYHQNAL